MNEIYHHGIKGQKWGVRRYQNPDGTLTAEGKKRYVRRETSVATAAGALFGGYYGAISAAILSGTIIPASVPVSMVTGALIGGSSLGYSFGKYRNRAAKEAVKGTVRDEDVTSNLMKVGQDHRDFKEAWKKVKNSGYLDNYPKEVQKGLKKEARKSFNFKEFDDRTILKYGDHPGDLVYDAIEDIQYKRKQGSSYIKDNKSVSMNYVNDRNVSMDYINSTNNMIFNQNAITESNRVASLGLSGGTNPFMFG